MFTPAARLWFRRLQHDLVKRLLWVARDCRDLGKQPTPGELVARLIDEEGHAIETLQLFEQLRLEAPPELELTDFEQALRRCLNAAEANDLDGVLALETEFERLRAKETARVTVLAPSLKGN